MLVLSLEGSVACWGDLDIFWSWALKLEPPFGSNPGPGVYARSSCEYPAVGVLATAGGLRAMGARDGLDADQRQEVQQRYRLALCAVETLVLALLILIFRELAPAGAGWGPVVLYLCPSSWAGGAVWGQIDVVQTCFSWLAVLMLVRVALRDGRQLRATAELTVALTAIVLALLTKPHALFSLPGLLGLTAVALRACQGRYGIARAAGMLLFAAGFAAGVWVLLDSHAVIVPVRGMGSFEFVMRARPNHGDFLFNHGANVWTFLGVSGASTSHEAFLGPLTPYGTGWAAFLGLFLLVAASLGPGLLRSRSPRQAVALLVGFIGLTHWMAWVFLTGAQARYLLTAFPYVWTAAFALGSARLWLATGVTAFVTGCFVLSLIDLEAFRGLPPLRSPTFAAGVALAGLFVALWGYRACLSRRFEGL